MSPARGSTTSIKPIAPPTASGPFIGPGQPNTRAALRIGIACFVLLVIAFVAWRLHDLPQRGFPAAFSLLIGTALGVLMQRGRFCFYCIFRDLIEDKDARSMYSVLTALAVGSICYVVILTAFMPDPSVGRLPPDAHIGPVSWALVLAGLLFGVGMALSGACISGHLYRLGEGYSRAPFALIGSLIGFGLGFLSWQSFYVEFISQAPLVWLPKHLGYSGSLAVQLLVIGGIALLLLRFIPERSATTGGKITWQGVWDRVFNNHWTPGATGAMVGVLGAFAYFRVSPLGVTSQIGSIARTVLSDAGMLGGRLNGLDTFSGCLTLISHAITNNGLLISGLVAASFAMALLSKRFKLSQLTVSNSTTALLGGILMGWGSMIALGCTVGTLLSGIMAFSLSGWIFFAAVFVGTWLGIKFRLHQI